MSKKPEGMPEGRVKTVFEHLDVVLSREEWQALCERHGCTLRYPFADVIAFPIRNRPLS